VPLSDKLSIEAGYIHQHNHRRGPDETNRIATVALSASW
jgi:hypothetical protein